MDSSSLETVSTRVPPQPSICTFVPAVNKLPIKNIITVEEKSRALAGKPNKESMSDGGIFKAQIVFIKDSVEGEAGSRTQQETKPKWMPSLDHWNLSQTKASPSVRAESENTPNHVAALTASMETAVDKHRGTSQQPCHDTFGCAEVSSGCFAKRERLTDCADLFPTPTSSRESILSEDSDKEKSWPTVRVSSVTSPVSFSRTVSPCSSVRSGVFTPSVVQIKKHFLAPGSSLVNIPQSCFSSCESLSSVCHDSSPPRHRPPLTRLSLLTAILRKGRLPVLSSALQRPYTPCWPVNPVTLSFCNACSAASSVASIPLEFSSQFSSSASIDIQSHVRREPNKCATAPPPVQSNVLSRTCPPTQVRKCSEEICSSNVPRWEQIISPPPAARSHILPRAPLPLFISNFNSVSSPKHEEMSDSVTSKTLQHTEVSISKCPEVKLSNTQMYLKGHADNNLRKRNPSFHKPINEQETSAPQKLSCPPNSSLSRLRLLSQQLRSPPVCPPQFQPPQSRSPGVTLLSARSETASPLPPLQNTRIRCESEKSCPDARSATPSYGFHKAHCLSPSRYTPIAFTGWPSPTSSPTPTPSPAPPNRELIPSPSFSLRATPSPRPGSGISDCSDREGKKRKTHKIKLSYKSLAAIPTNTLLLDQQAIDEQVEREESLCDTPDRGGTLDTHSEMCSPAQLRQQSEELYAVIDEVLANSVAPSKTSQQPSKSSTISLQQDNSSLQKSLGRETKYASVSSLHPPAGVERKKDTKMTNPGVIRPMTAIPRLTVTDEFLSNPLKPLFIKTTSTDRKKVEGMWPAELKKEFYSYSNGQMLKDESKPERRIPLSVCDLQIREPEDQISHSVKDSSSFSATEGWMETFKTHI